RVLEAREVARRRALELLEGAEVRAREVRCAGGAGRGQPDGHVVVEAAVRRRERALHDRPAAARHRGRRPRGHGGGGRRRGPAGTEVDGSGSHAAAAQFFARKTFDVSFVGALQRMQYRVPLPNWTCAFTAPCVPLSSSENPTPDFTLKRIFAFFTIADVFAV